ncbi:competence protein CoiA family protein [Paenibacillus brevis]|uniref:Competence protein CoiA-like N-terminal domain-containing protein n=1 Tax=Paenibacillus brevis TaxID=2841508 RepID=A0ABS6FLI9_9BACL|nr:competence protein CoiA family protein [Paenibacillus brevis]MBU5671062.1 hypothetical protein [Paenibacillus brevis]
MEWALDINQEHVHASSPGAIRGIIYVCPRCKKDTFLRKGTKRVPHFAHVSGQTNNNCELYKPPAIYSTKTEGKTAIDALSEYSPDIYLNIEKDNWSLEIKIFSAIGQYEGNTFVKLPFAWEGERKIPLSSIRTNGKKIRVKLQAEEYKVIVNGIVRDEWKMKLESPIKGLDEFKPTVFYYSRLGGRRLKESTSLQWGERYVLVWDDFENRMSHRFPPMLAIRKLQSQDNWSCMIIELPNSYDKLVEKWINQLLNRSVTFTLPEIRLVTPVSTKVINEGRFEISSSGKVVIGVTGTEGAKKWSTIHVYNIDRELEVQHLGNGQVPILLLLGKLPLGRTDIWLDDNRENALRLICQDAVSLFPTINGVCFRAVNFVGVEETCNLHSIEAKEFFRKIQDNKLTLTDIQFPMGINITVNLLGSRSNHWSLDTESTTEVVSILNNLLRQDEHIQIDACGLGSIEIMPKALSNANKFTMSTRWREQMKWMLISLQMINHKEVTFRNDVINKVDLSQIHNLSKKDQGLILDFVKVRFIPKSMFQYANAIIDEYRRLISVKKF